MTQQEVIKTFMQSLDKTELSGRAALDEAIQASSNFQNFEEFKRNSLTIWKPLRIGKLSL